MMACLVNSQTIVNLAFISGPRMELSPSSHMLELGKMVSTVHLIAAHMHAHKHSPISAIKMINLGKTIVIEEKDRRVFLNKSVLALPVKIPARKKL